MFPLSPSRTSRDLALAILSRAAACLAGTLVLMIAAPAAAAIQEAPQDAAEAEAGTRVRVFLDCGSGGGDTCFSEYLREQIDIVDFVRQPEDADVHVIASGRTTGSGGREVVVRFLGRGRFLDHDHEFRAVTLVGSTESTRREVVLRTVLIGLLDYVAEDGIPPGVNLTVTTDDEAVRPAIETDDPWNLWVFRVDADGSYEADERNRERNWQTEINADRVTEQWKLSFGAEMSQRIETFDLDEGEPLEVRRRDRRVDWFLAKGLGAHWSIGLRGRVAASTFSNNRFSLDSSPAIEFNVFPYDQYARRQLRIQYDVGVDHVKYNEVTIFEKLEETLWRHRVDAVLDQNEPWGSLRASFEFSQYLHDTSKYRLEGSGRINVRLARGLSINANGSVSRIRDQLSLPLRDATDQEVLLRLRQLQSGYEVDFGLGISYSFGSIFNNIVNPRFGG